VPVLPVLPVPVLLPSMPERIDGQSDVG